LFANNNRRVAVREVIQQVEGALAAFGFDVDVIPRNQLTIIAEEIMRLREERHFENVEVDVFDIARRLGVNLGQGALGLGGGWPRRRLDVNLPLMQLFWQTFLPWNEI
jgi:hypothetical protein